MQRRDDDCRSPRNMVQSRSQNNFSKRSMTPKIRPSVKSGACNVCSAPCSSCMHRNQPLMDPKNREYSDETCRPNVTSQDSVTASKRCESLQPATSETSHPISVNSSHDSVSENADSKTAVGIIREVELPPKPLSSLNPGGFVVKCEDSVSLETHDNGASCVSRANDPSSLDSTRSRNVDRKNILCSSASDSNLGVEDSKRRVDPVLSDMRFSKDGDAGSNSPKEALFESAEQIDGSSKEKGAVDDTSCPKSLPCVSDPSEKVMPKLETGVNSDHKEPPLQGEKSNERDIKEPPIQSASGEDGDDSDIVEHDVKVCDICGDAGREDMLAICSRCSDGAEHIYCMRKTLRKIPGSNWMCEECKFAEENSQKRGMEGKKMSKLSMQLSSKRLAENIEVAPAAKRQALETSIASPKSSHSSRMASLSRDSSFKSLDKERSRPTHHVHVSNQSTNVTSETTRSSIAGPRHQNLKGMLLKSNSFNNSNYKPKVKLVDDVIPQKKKGVKDHSSSEAKEMHTRAMGKSMSFKSSNLSRSSSSLSKLKTLSPRISNAVDPKGLKPIKERNTFERKSMSKLDHPPVSSSSSSSVSTPKGEMVSRAESSSLSFATNSRDLKAQTEGKSNTSKATRKPMEPPATSVGVPKDESNGTMSDGLFQPPETTYHTESSKESSLRPRQPVTSSSRSTFCQKCKEIGHSAEFCRNGGVDASGIDAPTVAARIRDEAQSGSKLKDAIHAALLRKPEIQRRKRTVDQLDESSTSNTNLDSEVATHEKSLVFNKPKPILSADGTNVGQHVFPIPVGKPSSVKPMEKDFTNHSLAPAHQLAKMSAIPEYEYTWRGCFEVFKSGNLLELCGGIQAHLSTCVSPRVPEVVQKFPKKLSLSEVPRSSTWPTQFCDGGAKDDNIALYFFARDLESYERNYKGLLHHMVKNDLALKGNFEGVELLIFPSNQLPETSQRWNMLFYLWGVFRARKGHCSDASNKSYVANTTTMPDDKKASYSVLRIPEPKFIDLESSGCDRSCSELSGDCNDQRNSEPMGLKANRMPPDSRNGTKFTSNVDSSDKLKCTSSSLREKSPSEPKPSLPVAGSNTSEITEKPHIDCNAPVEILPSKEEVGPTTTICEKKAVVKPEFARERSIPKTERKRPQIDLSEPPTQEGPWTGVSIGKKQRTGEGDSWRSKVKTEECEEKVIPEDLGSGSSAERHFFPVDSTLGWNSLGSTGRGEELRLHGGLPNLELGLGGETKPAPTPSKGILPFLVGNEKEEEDVSASLSLSLAFPIPDKDEIERRRVSTSLLLFGGYSEK